MKVLRETNTSQRYRGLTRAASIPNLQQPPPQLNVSQYTASGAELEDIENSKFWASTAEGFAKDAKASASAADLSAKNAFQSAIDSSNSADRSEAAVDHAEAWAKESERQANLSKKSADASATSASEAAHSAVDANTAKDTTLAARDKTLEYKQHAQASASESTASAAAAKTSEDNAANSEDLAYQWAEGYPTNSSKYWAEQAKHIATTSVISGGIFTPTAEKEYPDPPTTGTADIMYFVQFPDEFQTYLFQTGALAGKLTSSQDVMFRSTSSGVWSLLRSPLSNSVMTVNGKSGNVITLVPKDLGTYTSSEIDQAILTRVPSTRMVNGKDLSKDIALGAEDVNTYDKMGINALLDKKVDKVITVNGYPLSSNVTLDSDDVGARSNTWLPGINDLSGTIDFGTF